MKTRRALLVTPLLLAFAVAGDELAFHPADGSQATRDYSLLADFEMDDFTVVADGQDLTEMVPGDIEASAEMLMQVTDRFVKSEGGKPLELIRSFDEMSGEAEAMGESQDIDGFDDLAGKQVRFLWNEDDSDYQVSYHESEGEEEWLQDLSVDMDMRALLPDEAVEAGDTWTVAASELTAVLFYGSKLEMGESGGDEMAKLVEAELRPQFEALLEDFETTCEYKGAREEGGTRVGVIGLTMHGKGSIDLSSVIESAVEMQGSEVQIELDIDAAELKLTFDSKGELLWDLKSGRMHSFSMDGKAEAAFDVAIAADVAGESHSMDSDGLFTGTLTWKVSPATE